MRLLCVFLFLALAAFSSAQIPSHGFTRRGEPRFTSVRSIRPLTAVPFSQYESSPVSSPFQAMPPQTRPSQHLGIPYEHQQQQQLGLEYEQGAVGSPIQQGMLLGAKDERQSEMELATELMTKFILNALHHMNTLQVKGIEKASKMLSTPSVITLADTIARDHADNEVAVSEIANELGVKLYPFSKNTVEVAIGEEVGKLSGKPFELAFTGFQFGGNQLAIASAMILQSQMAAVQSKLKGARMEPRLMGLLGDTVHTLINHRNMAYRVMKEISAPEPKTPEHGVRTRFVGQYI